MRPTGFLPTQGAGNRYLALNTSRHELSELQKSQPAIRAFLADFMPYWLNLHEPDGEAGCMLCCACLLALENPQHEGNPMLRTLAPKRYAGGTGGARKEQQPTEQNRFKPSRPASCAIAACPAAMASIRQWLHMNSPSIPSGPQSESLKLHSLVRLRKENCAASWQTWWSRARWTWITCFAAGLLLHVSLSRCLSFHSGTLSRRRSMSRPRQANTVNSVIV